MRERGGGGRYRQTEREREREEGGGGGGGKGGRVAKRVTVICSIFDILTLQNFFLDFD